MDVKVGHWAVTGLYHLIYIVNTILQKIKFLKN